MKIVIWKLFVIICSVWVFGFVIESLGYIYKIYGDAIFFLTTMAIVVTFLGYSGYNPFNKEK